jgi:hypothetical protein
MNKTKKETISMPLTPARRLKYGISAVVVTAKIKNTKKES